MSGGRGSGGANGGASKRSRPEERDVSDGVSEWCPAASPSASSPPPFQPPPAPVPGATASVLSAEDVRVAVIVKLGGAAITRKDQLETLDEETLEASARAVARAVQRGADAARAYTRPLFSST
jgi:hypothetical protein